MAAALLAAQLLIVTACGDEPDVEVLGATLTQPEVARSAPAERASRVPLRQPAPKASRSTSDGPASTVSSSTTSGAPSTSLTTTTTPVPTLGASSAYTDIAAGAEALIDYPFRSVLSDWSIEFGPARESVRGLTFPQSRKIEVYIRDDDTTATVARVLAHEVGHALDVTYNSDDDREIWRAARGIGDSVPWWPNGTTFDFDTAAGDWAESFAVIQTGATHQSSVAGALTPQQVEVLLGLLP